MKWTLGGLACLVLSACATAPVGAGAKPLEVAAYKVRVVDGVTYTPDGWPRKMHATVYVPEAFGDQPGVLLVHDGLFDAGERADMSLMGQRLAEAGFVAVAVDYRATPVGSPPPGIADLEAALDWMRASAGQFDLDAQRLGIWGVGGGGTLAALVAGRARTPSGSNVIRALVAGGAAYDFSAWRGEMAGAWWSGDTARARSPVGAVHPGYPASWLYHGGLDRKVPFAQAESMLQALRGNDVPVDLERVEALGHSAMFVINRTVLPSATGFLRSILMQ